MNPGVWGRAPGNYPRQPMASITNPFNPLTQPVVHSVSRGTKTQPAMNLVTYSTDQLADQAKERLLKSRGEAFTNLDRVRIESAVFLPENFNELYGKFIAHLVVLAQGADKKPSPESEQSLRSTWIQMNVLHNELLN
jgi:hypothetical protein